MPRRHGLPLLALAALLLGGCRGDDKGASATTPATTAAVAPASGDRIAGSGYELRAAEGWTDVKAQLSSTSDVILATESGSVLNVLREQLAPETNQSEALESLSRSVLEGADATRLSASTPTTLDGADGITFRVRVKSDRGPADGRVVIVIHEGYAYAIAANTSPDEPVSTSRAFASMLRSWRWT
ncbi:MAG TPA: hypothetical protein VMY78_07870 [Solirubrobacteraceae bacterium]|nr:hypothetical protein [Solirubrobacteraceae bacterium]